MKIFFFLKFTLSGVGERYHFCSRLILVWESVSSFKCLFNVQGSLGSSSLVRRGITIKLPRSFNFGNQYKL